MIAVACGFEPGFSAIATRLETAIQQSCVTKLLQKWSRQLAISSQSHSAIPCQAGNCKPDDFIKCSCIALKFPTINCAHNIGYLIRRISSNCKAALPWLQFFVCSWSCMQNPSSLCLLSNSYIREKHCKWKHEFNQVYSKWLIINHLPAIDCVTSHLLVSTINDFIKELSSSYCLACLTRYFTDKGRVLCHWAHSLCVEVGKRTITFSQTPNFCTRAVLLYHVFCCSCTLERFSWTSSVIWSCFSRMVSTYNTTFVSLSSVPHEEHPGGLELSVRINDKNSVEAWGTSW